MKTILTILSLALLTACTPPPADGATNFSTQEFKETTISKSINSSLLETEPTKIKDDLYMWGSFANGPGDVAIFLAFSPSTKDFFYYDRSVDQDQNPSFKIKSSKGPEVDGDQNKNNYLCDTDTISPFFYANITREDKETAKYYFKDFPEKMYCTYNVSKTGYFDLTTNQFITDSE